MSRGGDTAARGSLRCRAFDGSRSMNWRPDYTEPLMRRELDIIRAGLRWPGQLTFSIGNELTLFMRGIVPGRTLAQRSRLPRLRQVVLPSERVDWDHFDVTGVNYYHQQARTT
jgi:hypothetical protein